MSQAGAAASSELRLRVVSSLVLAAVALLSVWVGGWFLAVVWFGAAVAVAHEWGGMARIDSRLPFAVLAGLGIGAVQLAWVFGSTALLVGVAFAATLCILALGRTARDRVWGAAGLLYAIPIALVPVVFRFEEPAGMWPLLWMFAVVWSTDVVAYFVGRAVGGPKLWPAISPKKTWSGFVGGLVGAVLAGTALAAFASTKDEFDLSDIVTIITLSALASVASQGGDLAESAMKRHFGVKDSGTLIPGHGGFMDRLDGFAAVAILVCLLLPLAKFSLWTVAP